eukprot:TRINITY_DN5343_c0_g1_i1.p1 TRINITY_DN5343_c0_g1~~TRINITY_DN5343_c0_g1_i1.p1  ORF type:complete len:373 (-),score=54.14 TRINITY_DN5343_c0_g1_i1:516-1634(-)
MCIRDRVSTQSTWGKMGIYNYFTGTLMKTLTAHKKAVICGLFCHSSKFIYTGSCSDQEIAIHDDKHLNQSVLLRTIRNENYYPYKFGITKEGYIVIGFSNGIIKIYENDASRTIDSFYAHQSEIIDMCVFKEIQFVVASDASGQMGLWVVPPAISKTLELYRWHNKDEKQQDSVINAIAISEQLKIICSADDKGMITAYDYQTLINGLGLDKKKPTKEFFNKLESSVIKTLEVDLKWKVATYPEGTNSLTFVNHEPYFLIATCYNRMAYIIRADNGDKIDCIQQGMSMDSEPIAYKLKEKHKNATNPEKIKAITEGEKNCGCCLQKSSNKNYSSFRGRKFVREKWRMDAATGFEEHQGLYGRKMEKALQRFE